MTYEIKHKNGTLLATAQSLTYSSKRMGEEFVTVTLRVSAPIDFQIGDYITYRGNNYYLNVTPTVKKKARNGSTGDAFVYDNIKFESASVELVNATFRDVVIDDNQLHTAMPAFSFMTNTAADLADRIKANLDALGSGWSISVTDAVRNGLEGKKNINISVDNINCWEALALINTEFDVNFSVRGRTITIGKVENVLNAEAMRYGLGNGLATIEKTTDENQQIITRLRAYGNTTNMPTRYYANLGAKCYLPIVSASATAYKKEWIDNGTLYDELAKNEYYGSNPRFLSAVIGTVFTDSDVVGKKDGVLFMASGTMDYAPSLFNATDSKTKTAEFSDINGNKFIATFYYYQGEYGAATYFVTETMSESDLKAMTRLTLRDSVNVDAWPVDRKEGSSRMPNNMHVDRLMLPSFPTTLDPYVQNDALVAEYGVREATVFFDGNNGLEDIHPTIENIDVNVQSAYGYEGNGIYGTDTTSETVPEFKIRIAFNQPSAQFNPWEYKIAGETPYISMKSGMNQGRQFEITGCVKVEDCLYELTCKRQEETAFSRYFPYNDYPIRESDTFVFIGIAMPDAYISAAAQKLQEAAEKYLADNSKVKYNYTLNLSSIFMQRQVDAGYNWHETITAGQSVVFEDADIIGSAQLSIPIESLEIKEGEASLPKYSIVLSDTTQASTISKVQSEIKSVAAQSITTLYPLAIKNNGKLVGTYNPAEKGLTVELQTGGGDGSQISSRLDDWDDYTDDKAEWVLSALLGVDLRRRIDDIEDKKGFVGTTEIQDEAKPQELTGITSIDGALDFNEQTKEVKANGNLIVEGNTTHNGQTTFGGKAVVKDKLQFGNAFDPNILTGFGGQIDDKGNGVLESLVLRRFLEVPELRYNRVDVKVGDKWRAPGAGIVERVVENANGTGTVYLKLEKGEIGLVKAGDICMGIFHDETPNSTKNSTYNSATAEPTLDSRGNRKFAGFFTAYFTITSVSNTANNANGSFTYRLRKTDGSEGAWTTGFHPCEAMHFVVYGNFTDAERQTSVYETLTYTRMLKDQDTWEISARNIALQYGDMTNLYVHGYEANGYSLMAKNLYITGNLKHIKDNGNEVNNINLLPSYTAGQRVDFYDAVVYNGETWVCIAEEGTTTTPSASEPAWMKMVEKPNGITGSGKYVAGNSYGQGSIVNFAGKLWICNKDTSRPPYDIYKTSDGKYVQYSDGSYAIVNYDQDAEQKAAWSLMIDTAGIKDGANGKDGKSLEVQYSADKTSWHTLFATGDVWMRQRLGDGVWSDAMRVVGETGEDGIDGNWTEFEFAIGSSLSTHPMDGWQDGPVENVPSGYYSWMRSRTHNGETGDVSAWSYTRIGGEVGNGITGVNEWYKASNKETEETFNPNSHTDWMNGSIPADWGEEKKYLWNVEQIGYSRDGVEYTAPTMIAIWTTDGRGIDRINEYYLATNVSAGVTRSTSGWSTTVPTMDDKKRFLWNYEEIVYTDGEKSYTDPALIGVKGEDGKDGEVRIGNLGLWKSGTFVKYLDIVRMGNGTFQCVNVNGTYNSPYGIYTTSAGEPLLYADGGYVLNGETNFDKYGADYSLVAMDGVRGESGKNGVDGANGKDIEYVYLRTNIHTTPDIVDKSGSAEYQKDDYLPVTSDGRQWTDNPQGVTETERYEFMAVRTKTGGAGGKGGTWSKFSNVTLWSAFGEKGQDGDGVEYIFARTKTIEKPSLSYTYSEDPASAYQKDDFTPSGWTDDPTGVDATWKYEWVVQRKSKNGVWQRFDNDIAMWAKYSEDGDSYVIGYAFTRSSAASVATPTGGTFTNPTPTTAGWSDGIPTGDSSIPVWMSRRKFSSDSTKTDAAWSTPVMMADTADFDVCYHDGDKQPDKLPLYHHKDDQGNGWTNAASEKSVWMATDKLVNGKWQGWQVAKIKGEKGEDGKDGLSAQYLGDWKTGMHVPYLGIVKMGTKSYQCLNPNGTDNPPAYSYLTSMGERLLYSDGKYVLTGEENLVEYAINSVDGEAVYTINQFVFVRSHTKPNKPSGGSFKNPIPSGWYDSIPSGDAEVWMSNKVFWSNDNATGDWSDPQKLADTADIDFEFSKVEENPGTPDTNPGNWSDEGTDAIWMATRIYRDGAWGAWQVVKIKGEDGYTPVKGKDFFDNIIADLDNEMDSVVTDKDGNFNGSVTLKTNVVLYSGIEQLTLTNVTFSSVTGVTSSCDRTSNPKVGQCSFVVTKAVADHAEVTITVSASKDGNNYQRNLTFTINKVKQGETGQNAVVYQLLPSESAIKIDRSGDASVSSIACGVVKVDGDARSVLSTLPSGFTMKVNNGNGETAYTLGSAYTSYTKDTKTVSFYLYAGSTLIDKETIPVVADGNTAVTAQLSTSSVMVLTDVEGKVKGNQNFDIGVTMSVGNELKGIDYLTMGDYDTSKFSVQSRISGGYYIGISVTAKNNAVGLASNTSFINFTVGAQVDGKRIDIPLSLSVTGTTAGAQGYNGCSVRAREWSEYAKEFVRTITGTRNDYTYISSNTSHGFDLCTNYVKGTIIVESYKYWVYNASGVKVDSYCGEVKNKKFVLKGTQYETNRIANVYIDKNYSTKVEVRVRFCGCEMTNSSSFYAQTYGASTYKTIANGNCYVTTEQSSGAYDPKNVIRQYYFNESNVASKGYGTRYIDIVLLQDESNASGYQAYLCQESHFANQYNKPKSTLGADPATGKRWTDYWSEADVQPFIQTDMLFAKHAKMVFASGNQILLQNEQEHVVGGMSGYGTASNQIRLWLGHETPDQAPFRVTENGEIYAEKGVFKGALYSEFAQSTDIVKYDKIFPNNTYGPDVDLPTGKEHIGRRISVYHPYAMTRALSRAVITCSADIYGKPVKKSDTGLFTFPSKIKFFGGVLEMLAVPVTNGYGTITGCAWMIVSDISNIQYIELTNGDDSAMFEFGEITT